MLHAATQGICWQDHDTSLRHTNNGVTFPNLKMFFLMSTLLYPTKSSTFFLVAMMIFANCFAQKPFKGSSGRFKRIVWSDEFNYKGLPDSSKWFFERGYVRNSELQYYTQRPENVFAQDGTLVISALNDSLIEGGKLYPVSSASLTTKGKKEWTYGRLEVRAKLPSSLGTWPAIWTLGANRSIVGWPACGEIDIMEHVGYIPDTVFFTVHTAKYNHVKKNSKGASKPYPGISSEFHIYAIEWFKDRIDWYMDDKKVFTYKNEQGDKEAAWPFDAPQYLILNLAFGGAWGGTKGVDISSLPQRFYIDYVRLFQ